MRKIIGNISNFYDRPANGVTITFVACDKYSNEKSFIDFDGEIVTTIEVVTEADGAFEANLSTHSISGVDAIYAMKFGARTFILYMHQGSTDIDFKYLIAPLPNLKGFYKQTKEGIVFCKSVENILEEFMLGAKRFGSLDEKKLFETFVNFADGKNTMELMNDLDQYLGEII